MTTPYEVNTGSTVVFDSETFAALPIVKPSEFTGIVQRKRHWWNRKHKRKGTQ